jgi:hypothetical protein
VKKLIVVGILIAQSIFCFGQYFNKSVEASPDALGTFNIERIGLDSIIIFPAGINNNALYIHSIIINDQGDTLINKNYFKPSQTLFTGWTNSTSRTLDGGFIMGGGLQDTVTYGHLIKFNRFGDTLWTRTYGDTMNFHTFRQAIQLSSKEFLVVGEKKGGGWLLKTDSIGNVIWNKYYNTHGDVESLTSVYPTTDGGYILGGFRRHYISTKPWNNYDPMIIKVDSMGIEEWTYIYDTPYNEAVAYVIQTMDGNYVFGSSISVSQNGSTGNGNGRATLFKVDTAGNLIWNKSFGFVSSNHGFQLVKELPDSSLIAVGRRKETTSTLIKGLMVKTDQNGDSIFVQTYEHDPGGTNNHNYLWDVIPMDDGGFMAAGEVIGLPPGATYRQDAWVIRVDSMGCVLANCLVGNEGLKRKDEGLKVYPNPTNGWVNLKTTAPLNSIEVYNLQGQKVQSINPSKRSWQLPQESGLYLIRMVTEDGEVVNKKVVKG